MLGGETGSPAHVPTETFKRGLAYSRSVQTHENLVAAELYTRTSRQRVRLMTPAA